MKIGFYLASFPVLSQTFIHRQIASMMRRGHDVFVIAKRQAPLGDMHETVVANRMLDRSLFLEGVPGDTLSVASFAGKWFLRDPVRFVSEAAAAAFSMSAARNFKRKIRYREAVAGEGRFDAVVAHFGPAALEAQRLVDDGILQAPVYPVFHGYDMTRYVKEKGPDCYRRLFEAAPLCLAISERWVHRLVELGCPPEKAIVHRVGLVVDDIRFEPRESFQSPLRVLSVARLVEKKGIEHAIRAVAMASRSADVRYSVVGDGPLRDGLVALAGELGVSDRVSFLGAQPEQEVARLMAGSDVLLVPSVVASDGDEEGIPVVIMEAMASGLPVIASRHSGIPELVEDGVTGTLVAEGDEAGLAAAIMRLCASGPDREKLDAARSKVEGLHSSTELAHELEKLLMQAASH